MIINKLFKYMSRSFFPDIDNDYYGEVDTDSFYKKVEEEIRSDEGFKNEAYRDSMGFWTIGIGHRIKDSEKSLYMSRIISNDEVVEIFKDDVFEAENAARIIFTDYDSLPDEIKSILLNMIFNLGMTRFKKFKKLIVAINHRDWKKAAVEMKDSKWYYQLPNRATRLINRMNNFKK